MYRTSIKSLGIALACAAALVAGCTGGQQGGQSQPGGGGGGQSPPPSPPQQSQPAGGTGGGEKQINEAARKDLQAKFDQVLAERPITFEPGSAQLTPQGQQTVAEVAKLITSSPGQLTFQLTGYTAPAPGTPEAAKQLSTQRAQTVADQMKQMGVTDTIKATGAGDAPPNSGPGRRVDIKAV